MISNKNKVGSQLKNGSRLDYSESRKWKNIIVVALEDIENNDNISLSELILDIVNEKRLSALTGGISETLPYDRLQLETPKLHNMTNKEKNDRLISHKKKAEIKDEFWNNEFEALKSNIQEEYNQLKDKIIKDQVRVKPKSSIKVNKKNIVSKILSSVIPRIKPSKSSVIPVIATEIPYADAKYVSGELNKYHEQALTTSKKYSADVVLPSPSKTVTISHNNKKSRSK